MIFFKKCKKCYDLINCIYNEKYKTNKDYFINFLNKFKLSVNILYKLNEACLDKLKMFFNEKFEIDVKIEKRIEINYNEIIDKYDTKTINKICRDIPLTYLGSKRNSINKVITKLLNCKGTIRLVDLFGGSLCVSYVVKSLLPEIDITVYVNIN